jgi:hypothetical protein
MASSRWLFLPNTASARRRASSEPFKIAVLYAVAAVGSALLVNREASKPEWLLRLTEAECNIKDRSRIYK